MERNVKCELDPGKKHDIHKGQSPFNTDSNFDYRKPSKKKLVGIVNCTPDSFYDGGFHNEFEHAVAHGKKLLEEGADIIDIGGESTRPGSKRVSLEEEIRRVTPVIEALNGAFISIDSFKPEVVEAAIAAGATMINDITGCSNPKMRSIVKSSKLPVCIMHMQGTPATMQQNPTYQNSVVGEIKEWFLRQVDLMVSEGIDPKQIIFDPGIGFGKSINHNFQIINGLEEFSALGFPLYLGLSRKSFMQKILGLDASQVLPTTLALGTISLLRGVDYLRVHDVKEHREILTILEYM